MTRCSEIIPNESRSICRTSTDGEGTFGYCGNYGHILCVDRLAARNEEYIDIDGLDVGATLPQTTRTQ